ncbi:centrosomal protein, partial [Clarias magur]
MKRKSRKLSLLSPNEEALLLREELHRRRKLRLQQVREQERYIALQVRREVQERKERELQGLATALQDEWQKQRGERIKNLEKRYRESLRDVGQGHRDAKENEPNREALVLKKEQDEARAAERHQKALRNLVTQRQAEEEQRNRHVEARKKALMVEKERAAKIASLPPAAPDPIEKVAIQHPVQPKVSNTEHYCITHYHVPETAGVDRGTVTVQADAQEAAVMEARRLEELEKEEARDRQEQLERARLRGNHALRKEKGFQNNARLLCELERLQQAELQRRRLMVNNMPAQIFQPLCRQDELRAERQRDLEVAFQDLCTEDKEIRDDLVLQMASEPLPHPPLPSAKADSRPESDLDLDVTLEPKETPFEEEEQDGYSGEEPIVSQNQAMRSTVPADGTGRVALRRLLDRIRTQRDQWSSREPAEEQGEVRVENTSSDRGSLSNVEWQQASSLEEGTVDTSAVENNSKQSEDSPIVAGPVTQEDDQISETDGKLSVSGRDEEEELQRQQQEQFALLQELEEKRRSLELELEEAQRCRQRLQEALQEPSSQETPTPLLQETVSEPSPEVKVSAPLSDRAHVQRLQQYQQRLLMQNRLHKKTIDDACRSLEEYKHALKIRYAPVTTTTEQTPPPSVTEQAVRSVPPLTTITHLLNTEPGPSVSTQTPVVSDGRSKNNIELSDPTRLAQPPVPSPAPALTAYADAHVTVHALPEDDASTLPHPAPASLSDKRLSDGSPELQEVPLIPPAVFLEYLRSRRSQATPTNCVPVSQQVSKDPAVGPETRDPCWNSEMEKNQQVRDRIRKQKDVLHELLRAQHAKEQSVSLGMPDSAVKAYEKSNESQSRGHTPHAPAFEFSEHPQLETPGSARVNPPVSCPPRTLQILLHDFEQHKLSTIEEVDTPVNVTMDTAAEVCTESSSAECSDYSNSCGLSSTPPTVGSGRSPGPSLGSEVMRSDESSRRPSRLSWREMLQLESAASHAGTDSTDSERHVEELELVLPHDGATGVPDFLSSTTLSTGSYLSSEHDPNFNITDSSLISNEFPAKPETSLSRSSSLFGFSVLKPTDSSHRTNSLQHIIDKYTKDLDQSLRSVHTGGTVSAQDSGNPCLSFRAEQNADAGTRITAPQVPMLPLQRNLEDSSSLNNTAHDSFQPLSPEITNNDMAESSATLQLPLNPRASEDSSTHADTTASDWLDCGLPQHVSSADEQSSSVSAGIPQWEWTLMNNSEFRNDETSVSQEEVSRLQNASEVMVGLLTQRSFEETETSRSTDGSFSQSEEVEHMRELHSRQDAYAKNQEKAKQFRM